MSYKITIELEIESASSAEEAAKLAIEQISDEVSVAVKNNKTGEATDIQL